MENRRNTLTTNTRKKAKKMNLLLSRINKKTETEANRIKRPAFTMSVQPGDVRISLALVSKKNPDKNTITPAFRIKSVTVLYVSDPLMG
ncbi:MAG: hypothetical protein AB9834_18700 [Lentimicrobium sp.]